MSSSLKEGAALWWRLGPFTGTRAAARAGVRVVRTPARRARLRIAPPRVTARQLARALGTDDAVAALRGPARAALPTVAALEERLPELAAEQRTALLKRADAVCRHEFDLLGSGPVGLGAEIDWHADFKTGRRWPSAHISEIPIGLGDGSDIKVPWELSRFQHMPLLAAAHRLTGDARYLDEIGAQLRSWIARNPIEHGPNWACTMDVAIRAANWVAALVLCCEAARDAVWLDDALRSLLLHGRFIRAHLEYSEIRGNHYLSDVVGLLPVAAVFSAGPEGTRWARWAADELLREMEHQVRRDGCDHEASIPYHRLVTELFVCGTHAVDALAPGVLTPAYRNRLDGLLRFTASYLAPSGIAPLVGDNDSARFLPLEEYGAGYRSHLHLFAQAGTARPEVDGHAAFPDSGYWLMRGGELRALVRCGDVGLYGRGCHAHNDALSFELGLADQPLVVDPGTFVYTADPAERNRFRSTGWHSTLRVGGGEQNALREDRLFVMDDRARPELVAWAPCDDGRAAFTGRHHGFEALSPPATHERRLEFDGPAGALTITDTVRGQGEHELEWTFPLAPGATARATDEGVEAEIGDARLTVAAAGLRFAVEDGWFAPEYGVREHAPFLRARRRGRSGEDRQVIELRAARR